MEIEKQQQQAMYSCSCGRRSNLCQRYVPHKSYFMFQIQTIKLWTNNIYLVAAMAAFENYSNFFCFCYFNIFNYGWCCWILFLRSCTLTSNILLWRNKKSITPNVGDKDQSCRLKTVNGFRPPWPIFMAETNQNLFRFFFFFFDRNTP